MTRITNTIPSASIPNPQYKIYLNGRPTLTLITPNHPSRCVSWNYNHFLCCGLGILGDRIVFRDACHGIITEKRQAVFLLPGF